MRQRHEEIGITKVAIVFQNFVLRYKVITEGVVSELGHQSVILMGVALPVCKD
jgi:hypothetical protein